MIVEMRIGVEACARAAHEANRAYCLALGDTSQLPWEEALGWQRDSAIKGVHKDLIFVTVVMVVAKSLGLTQ